MKRLIIATLYLFVGVSAQNAPTGVSAQNAPPGVPADNAPDGQNSGSAPSGNETTYNYGDKIGDAYVFDLNAQDTHGIVCFNTSLASNVNRATAQQLVANYNMDGQNTSYGQWRLPSITELGLIYKRLKFDSQIPFESNYFWSNNEGGNGTWQLMHLDNG